MHIPRALLFVTFFLVLACGSSPRFTEAPTVEANPNPAAPLAAVLRFAASQPSAAVVRVSDADREWELVYDESHDPLKGLAVVGMRPDRDHQVRVTLRNEDGAEAESETLSYRTPPLPEDEGEFPPIEVRVSKPEEMEPGYTLFNPQRSKTDDHGFSQSFGMLVAVDPAGEPVWYYRTDFRITDFERTRNGRLLVLTEDSRLLELDWLGNVVRRWYALERPEGPAEGVAVDTLIFHHDIDELPNGNLVILGSEIREIPDYYTSDTNPNAPRKTQRVMGDEIVEFNPVTGEVVWGWNTFDNLDPFRIGYGTFGGYWQRHGFSAVADWSHANDLLYDEADNAILLNLRFQGAIIKIDRESGEIVWIFGDPSGWGKLADKLLKPEGQLQWPDHQHSPQPTPRGTLLLFDNGNYQARPFDKPKSPAATHTRIVEYAVDEEQRAVRQLWQSEEPENDRVVSLAMGDVDWLPQTENLLVSYGRLLPRPVDRRKSWGDLADSPSWTRIREYHRGDPSEIVWEISLGDESGQVPVGWSLFGGERLPNLGP